MGVEGLEPSRPIDQQILSLLCLPFHHTPTIFKATPRFELGIEDLQSTALPLGHIALFFTNFDMLYITNQSLELQFPKKLLNDNIYFLQIFNNLSTLKSLIWGVDSRKLII